MELRRVGQLIQLRYPTHKIVQLMTGKSFGLDVQRAVAVERELNIK